MKLPYLIGFLVLATFSLIPILSDNQPTIIENTITLSVGVEYTPEEMIKGLSEIVDINYDETMVFMDDSGMTFLRAGRTSVQIVGTLDGNQATINLEIEAKYAVSFADDILPTVYFDEPQSYELPLLNDMSDFIGWADINNPRIPIENTIFVNQNYELIPLFETEQRYNLTAYSNYDLEYGFVNETLSFYVISTYSYLENEPLFLELSDESLASLNEFEVTLLKPGFLTVQLVNEQGELKDRLVVEIKEATGMITVNFEMRGGNEIESIEIPSGSRLSIAIPVREGYRFNGFVDETIERAYEIGDFLYESVTLTAQWSQINTQIEEDFE